MYRKRNWTRFCRLMVLAAAVLLVAGTWAQGHELLIHFLDVGQGDSILIQTPAGANILVDAGDTKAG